MRERSGWRGTLVALSLFALTLRLLIPAGFMPGKSLSMPIVVCTGQGPMLMTMNVAVDPDHRSEPGQTPSHGSGHPCDFASLGASALFATPIVASMAPTVVADDGITTPRPQTAPGRGIAAPPPPSHAPPTIRA